MRIIALLSMRIWLGWAAFALLLVGIGWGLHTCLPPEPRWVVRGPLTPVEFSADGTTLRVLGDQGNPALLNPFGGPFIGARASTGPLQIWDSATGRLLFAAFDQTELKAYTFSRDGKWLFVVTKLDDRKRYQLSAIDTVLGEARHTTLSPAVHEALDAQSIELAPRGQLVVLGDQGGMIAVYETTALRQIVHLEAQAYAWAANGNTLFAVAPHEENNLRILRVSTAGAKDTILRGAGELMEMASGGHRIVTSLSDDPDDGRRTLVVWDLDTARPLSRFPGSFVRHDNRHLSPDGRILATYQRRDADTGRLCLWDVVTGRKLWDAGMVGGWIDWNFTPDSRSIMFSGQSAELVQRELATGRLQWQRHWLGTADFISHSPAGPLVFVTEGPGGKNCFELVDSHDGGSHIVVPASFRHFKKPTAWIANEHLLINDGFTECHSDRGMFREWLGKWFLKEHSRSNGDRVIVLHTGSGRELFYCEYDVQVNCLLTEDGRTLVIYRHDGTSEEMIVECFDVPAIKPLRWLVGVPLAIGAVLLSPWVALKGLRRTRPPVPQGMVNR
jgi:hypothetical protein